MDGCAAVHCQRQGDRLEILGDARCAPAAGLGRDVDLRQLARPRPRVLRRSADDGRYGVIRRPAARVGGGPGLEQCSDGQSTSPTSASPKSGQSRSLLGAAGAE